MASAAQAAGQTAQVALAEESVRAALRHFNNLTNWTWLQATASASGAASVATAALPSDYRFMYEVKLQGNDPRTLFYTDRREYNRAIYDQTGTDTPGFYTLYYAGNSGVFEFVPTPAAAVTATIFYHRRMTIATATAAALDFPDDYVDYLLAWAKWHYLKNKTDMTERASEELKYALLGIGIMLEADKKVPDEDTGFKPPDGSTVLLHPPNNLAELRQYYRTY